MAQLVPISVPFFYLQNVSPNQKMFFSTVKTRHLHTKPNGKLKSLILSPYSSMKHLVTHTPYLVSMLPYIPIALTLKNIAPSGSCPGKRVVNVLTSWSTLMI